GRTSARLVRASRLSSRRSPRLARMAKPGANNRASRLWDRRAHPLDAVGRQGVDPPEASRPQPFAAAGEEMALEPVDCSLGGEVEGPECSSRCSERVADVLQVLLELLDRRAREAVSANPSEHGRPLRRRIVVAAA